MARITDIEGIGSAYADKLRRSDVRTSDDLLKKAGTRKGRKELSEQIGVSEKVILQWLFMADLLTIEGIGPDEADLLNAAGVDYKPELALRNAQSLHEKMLAVNEKKRLVHTVPTLKEVVRWIELARKAPRLIEY
jgi:predicted flap endonuclease-1-like 5' DNA nuclease